MFPRWSHLAYALLLALASPAAAADSPIAPKVLVITMFGGEAKPWRDGDALGHLIPVPGLSKAFPNVACSDDGLCMVTTGMGYANAATSVAAVVFSGRFDLTKTYFLISGIAGVDPAQGTLGSAHWARFVVDGGLQNEIDPREAPADWTSGYLAIGASAPGEKAELQYGDEIYRLNEDLLQAAISTGRRRARAPPRRSLPAPAAISPRSPTPTVSAPSLPTPSSRIGGLGAPGRRSERLRLTQTPARPRPAVRRRA